MFKLNARALFVRLYSRVLHAHASHQFTVSLGLVDALLNIFKKIYVISGMNGSYGGHHNYRRCEEWI
jgi:hypothetical protein